MLMLRKSKKNQIFMDFGDTLTFYLHYYLSIFRVYRTHFMVTYVAANGYLCAIGLVFFVVTKFVDSLIED